MALRLLLLICLLLPLAGCKKSDPLKSPEATDRQPVLVQPDTPATPLSAPPFLSQPLDTTVIESTNEALPIWRKFAKHRPVLVIVAQSPGLVPIPEAKLDETRPLLKSADDASLKSRTGMTDPDPVFLPLMSVSAALDAGWFSGLVWVFPTSSSPEKIDPDVFRRQVVEAGFATSDEAQALTFTDGVFRGTVRGSTLIAAPLQALPTLEQPVLLHIDCDYFKPLYQGEIKTPLYPLLVKTLNALKANKWQVAAATVARSTLGAELPLQTRFVGGQIAEILTEPEMLDRPIPESWSERANALYLENFMQKEKMRKVYLALEKDDPADPSLKYALYHLARQFNHGDDALDYLQQAVQIDPVYALEYSSLADLALQRKKPEQAVKMLTLARAARPDDPFLLLHLARTKLNAGDRSDAAALAGELRTLHWSEDYYPGQNEAQESLVKLLNGE